MTCIKISALSITMDDVDYKMKYIKYKVKYLQLLEELEGGFFKSNVKKLEKELTEIFDDIKKLDDKVIEDTEVNKIKDKRDALIKRNNAITKKMKKDDKIYDLISNIFEYLKKNDKKKEIFINTLSMIVKELRYKMENSNRYSKIHTAIEKLNK